MHVHRRCFSVYHLYSMAALIFRKVAWHLLLKIALIPGQTEKTEIVKAEKMHGPGTLNVSFFIRSGLKMKVKV